MKEGNTYFVSDVHLGASYINDARAHELRFVKWLKEIEPDCARLYLVGDIIDYWYEYKNVVPKGFTRFFGQLASMADKGIKITWFKGNHDIWIFDYLPAELGIKVVDGYVIDNISGTDFFISHGDGLGKISRSYRIMRSVFRNTLCQKMFSWLHPGLTMPFAHGWSKQSRKSGCNDKTINIEPLKEWVNNYSFSHPEIKYYILGHYHLLLDEPVGENSQMVILGDWINKFSYAVFNGKELITRIYY